MQITVFKNIHETQVPYHRSIEWAIERIRNGKNRELIEYIRSIPDRNDRNKVKAQLPSYLFQGIFEHRSKQGIQQFTGLIALDFDHIGTMEQVKEFKEQIIEVPFTYLAFISPSGDGLKVFFKVDENDIENYVNYFNAIENYFSSEYFDTSVKDFSRVCFESYDPDIFYNPDAQIWIEKDIEEAEDLGTFTPLLAITSENRIITNLLTWFNRKYPMAAGQRNSNLFKLAAALNDFGINKTEALNVCLQWECKDFPKREIDQVVSSAYKKKETFGTKYFEDNDAKEIIEKQIRDGKTDDDIFTEFDGLDRKELKKVVSSIRKEITVDDFWEITSSGKVSVKPHKYKYWLQSKGFYKFYPESGSGFTFVQKDQNLLTVTDENKIKDYVLEYLLSRQDIGYLPYDHMANSPKYFRAEYLQFLDTINLEIKKDTKTECFLYYRNGMVAISKDKVELIDYVDVDGFVWKDQIIAREYHPASQNGDFKRFIQLISNAEQEDERYRSLRSVIGYLCHNYKTSAHNRAIIINDETISENPNGGSGKGLLTQAIGKVRNLASIDGKTFSFDKAFPYQTVKVDTQVMVFDDVRKNFIFENLFSLITEGITIEYKGKDAIKLQVDKSPKVMITTNYTIGGVGGSFERRKFEIELSDHFSYKHTPLDEFGHMLYDDWNNSQWLAFDNFIIECIQIYLREGLIKYEFKNLETRKFIKDTSYEFFEYVTEGNLPLNTRIKRKEKYEEFLEEYPDQRKYVTNKRFYSFFETYAKFKGLKLITGKTNGDRWSVFEDEKNPYVEEDDPFEKVETTPF